MTLIMIVLSVNHKELAVLIVVQIVLDANYQEF